MAYFDTLTCGGCSGKPGDLVSLGGGVELYHCMGCGGLIGRGHRANVAPFVGLGRPMWGALPTDPKDDPADMTYFDIDLVPDDRVHGWFSPSNRRVVQYG